MQTIQFPGYAMYEVDWGRRKTCCGENLLKKVEPPPDDGETVPEERVIEHA